MLTIPCTHSDVDSTGLHIYTSDGERYLKRKISKITYVIYIHLSLSCQFGGIRAISIHSRYAQCNPSRK